MRRIAQTIRLRPDPCQEPWPDRGSGGNWSDLTEVWHLSAPASAGEGGPQPGLDS